MKQRFILLIWGIACLGLLLSSCTGQTVTELAKTIPAPSESPATPSTTDTIASLVSLKTEPEKGPVGTFFTISGEGLPPGRTVDFMWVTWDGSYAKESGPENVVFLERQFVEKRVSLGSAISDAKGGISISFVAPEDYGEIHDIYGVIDGQDIAKAGFRILRTATLTPTQGPVGTPITISLQGVGRKPWDNTMALRYDNKYTGFVTAVTTSGTVDFQIMAAGPVGEHVIQLTGASAGTTYLNVQQSPVSHIPMDFAWDFSVTKDNGAPPPTLDWPDANRVLRMDDDAPRTTATAEQTDPGVSAVLKPASGPILSPTVLRVSGLSPSTEVELLWVTTRGNRSSPTGWTLLETPLFKATTEPDGSLTANIQVPDDLGGWHVMKLKQGDKVLKEIPYYVERSLVTVTPSRVRAGETFTVQIKGIGWTELDNGVAVNYDNAYIGYACGFSTNGDITMILRATGGPGTHLIDLYPMLYRAKGVNSHPEEYWNYEIPHLTALQDEPGLDLGYKLPIFRLAIEVDP
jgi:hypothetical protein